MPEPLRTRPSNREKQDLTAPEALVISALLETGKFDPESYHIADDAAVAWRKLWDFCVGYQTRAGCAPPLSLVQAQFPEFDHQPEVNPGWAAEQLLVEASFRDLRTRGGHMISAINDGDVEGAYAAMQNLTPPRGSRRDPVSIFDHNALSERFDVARIEVPYPTLQRALRGGLEAAELMLLGMRLGQGKTFVALNFAARAASIGYNVGVQALEMPARQVTRRVLRHLAGRDLKLANALDSEEEAERKEAMDIIADRTPGRVDVFDPSHGRVNTVATTRDMCRDYDLVIVDHCGLMQSSDNRRAVEDWHVSAGISNGLREATLATNTTVIGVVQINRAGDHPGTTTLPKPSEIGQSDAWGQDASIVITGKRISARVLKMSAPKVREGENVTWYTRFEPERNRFEEISKDVATDLSIEDVDKEDFT